MRRYTLLHGLYRTQGASICRMGSRPHTTPFPRHKGEDHSAGGLAPLSRGRGGSAAQRRWGEVAREATPLLERDCPGDRPADSRGAGV
jgi:hypothetical protein